MGSNEKEQEILRCVIERAPTFDYLCKRFDDRIIKTLFKKGWMIHRFTRSGLSYINLTGAGISNLTESEK